MSRHHQPAGWSCRRPRPWGAAVALPLLIAGCADDPSTIRVVVEAPPAPDLSNDCVAINHVELTIVGTGPGGSCACAHELEVTGDTDFPFVAEFARGSQFDAVSVRVVWRSGATVAHRLYLYAAFPASGNTTLPARFPVSCCGQLCEATDCGGDARCSCHGGTCTIEPRLAPQLLGESWDEFNCSMDCPLPRRDADAGDSFDDAADHGSGDSEAAGDDGAPAD